MSKWVMHKAFASAYSLKQRPETHQCHFWYYAQGFNGSKLVWVWLFTAIAFREVGRKLLLLLVITQP